MSYYDEFPRTRTYDSDLGWLIRYTKANINNIAGLQEWAAAHKDQYKELKDKVDGLIENLVDVVVPWDSSVAYHIFTIVEYQGTNYIAIQDVPVGVMITNTEYWEPANTVVEQINAISIKTSELSKFVEDKIKIIPIYANGARGDATLVIFPDEKTLLIDTYDTDGAQYVADALDDHEVTKLDYIMISHYHGDHFRGLTTAALQAYITNATVFFLPQDVPNSFTELYNSMEAVKAVIENKGASIVQPITNGETYNIDDNINIEFLNVVHNDYYTMEPFDYNNCSLCAKLTFFNKSAFFSGDIATAAQTALKGKIGNVSVFKAQHHGSDDFQNAEFLEELDPEITYCCNAYPATEYYYKRHFGAQMASFGKSVYLTETNGTFEIELDTSGVKTVAAADGIFNKITSVYQLIGYGIRGESLNVSLNDLLPAIPVNTSFDFSVNTNWMPNFLTGTGINPGTSIAFGVSGTKYYNNYYTIKITDTTRGIFWLLYVDNNTINADRTREYSEVVTVDMNVQVTSTSGAILTVIPAHAKRILSANILYNDDWYHLIRTDGRSAYIAIRDDNKVSVLFTGAYAADRTLPVRIAYIPYY